MPWGFGGWEGRWWSRFQGIAPPLRGWKLFILGLLARESLTAKEILARISGLSYGLWMPAPPSIYVALKDLEAAGLVRKVGEKYELTEEGKKFAENLYPLFPVAFFDPIEILKKVVEELEKRKLTEEEKKTIKELAERLSKL